MLVLCSQISTEIEKNESNNTLQVLKSKLLGQQFKESENNVVVCKSSSCIAKKRKKQVKNFFIQKFYLLLHRSTFSSAIRPLVIQAGIFADFYIRVNLAKAGCEAEMPAKFLKLMETLNNPSLSLYCCFKTVQRYERKTNSSP